MSEHRVSGKFLEAGERLLSTYKDEARRLTIERDAARACAAQLAEALNDIANYQMRDEQEGYSDAYRIRDMAIDALAAGTAEPTATEGQE